MRPSYLKRHLNLEARQLSWGKCGECVDNESEFHGVDDGSRSVRTYHQLQLFEVEVAREIQSPIILVFAGFMHSDTFHIFPQAIKDAPHEVWAAFLEAECFQLAQVNAPLKTTEHKVGEDSYFGGVECELMNVEGYECRQRGESGLGGNIGVRRLDPLVPVPMNGAILELQASPYILKLQGAHSGEHPEELRQCVIVASSPDEPRVGEGQTVQLDRVR